MARMVHCIKLEKEVEGLDFLPFHGFPVHVHQQAFNFVQYYHVVFAVEGPSQQVFLIVHHLK